MQSENSDRDLSQTSGNSPPDAALPTPNPFAESESKKPRRTWGLRIFDNLVYTVFNNTTVFVISVLATYLSQYGGAKYHDGTFRHGRIGQGLSKRTDRCIGWLKDKFLGHSPAAHEGAKSINMILWSFFDGSIVAVAVKLLEDKREKVAQWIDRQLGTEPADKRVYEAEPKQSWKSVLLGRLLTAGIVAPTGYFLDKKGYHRKFYEWGDALGKRFTNRTNIKEFGAWQVGGLAHVSIFEAVYTSICTLGLYFSSRGLARFFGEHTAPPLPPVANDNFLAVDAPKQVVNGEIIARAAPEKSKDRTPGATIVQFSPQGRIHNENLTITPN